MSLLQRLFRPAPDAREALRPLWAAVVAAARGPEWYAECGVADTVEGRFDMVTLVLATVLLRLERDGEGQAAARLTELFVDDMDAQLRQSGVGDLVVGKHVGKLMATLGGRLGALREALPEGPAAIAGVVARNLTLADGAAPGPVADRLAQLDRSLAAVPRDALLAGRLTP
jgi:cytochrome b pre-mRNA-processing protein 3